MTCKRIIKAIIMTIVFTNVMADPKIIMLTSDDSNRRSDWESMGGGWPAPMEPPKILLLKNSEGSDGGGKKEDKLESLMPILMSIGPVILIAILLPLFMSLISGIMGFVKSLLAMKMPATQMIPVNVMQMPAADRFLNTLHRRVLFRGRNQNSSLTYDFPMKMEDVMLRKNLSSVQFSNTISPFIYPVKMGNMMLGRNLSALEYSGT